MTTIKDCQLMLGDCLERMSEIPDGSVDMILADLPYGTTQCKWDVVIPFEPLWEQYWRALKDNGAVILFGSQPFTSILIKSQLNFFRYEIIWEKDKPSNFCLANKHVMKYHENICIFYKKFGTFNKQMRTVNEPQHSVKKQRSSNDGIIPNLRMIKSYGGDKTRNPKSVIPFSCVRGNSKEKTKHPTQKPVALLEYLIRTYTNEGETVLDNVMGSGSTGVACLNTSRRFIGIEKDADYFEVATKRIAGVANGQTTS